MEEEIRKTLSIPASHTFSTNVIDKAVVGGYVIERLDSLLRKILSEDPSSSRPDTSLVEAETLLLYAWQELNTGKWSDVNINWHKLYAAVSWLKAVATVQNALDGDATKLTTELWVKVVEICDMGHLMGGDVWDDILIRTISNVEEFRLKEESSAQRTETVLEPPRKKLKQSVPEIKCPIRRLDIPSLVSFRNDYVNTKTPVIIQDAVESWPAMQKWSPEYVRQVCGWRTVPVELGKRYTDDDWGQQLMTVSQFIDRYIYRKNNSDGQIAYLAQHDLFAQAPTLRDDITIPDYIPFCGDDDPDLNAWFGPEGTISPLHYDPKDNLLAQVIGYKYIRLYAEHQSEKVYPHVDSSMLRNTSQVDVENPDYHRFPLMKEAVYEECVLGPGDVLYIPPECWHYVRSLSVSFSVSFWFTGQRKNGEENGGNNTT